MRFKALAKLLCMRFATALMIYWVDKNLAKIVVSPKNYKVTQNGRSKKFYTNTQVFYKGMSIVNYREWN
jgi:hypothetical protein